MKQRFNALDIRATVINLRERLVGIRLQNIYDVNAKTFLFKFAKPDDKELVLIESGTRIHSTQFSREKQVTPSQFCAKLRKHLRTRRVTNVRQVGVDRIVDFEFAGGEKSMGYHIIAEFYASGNIILTDHDYRILALLRVVQPNETVKMAVGEVYDIKNTVSDFKQLEVDELRAVLRKAGPKDTLKKTLNMAYEYGPAMMEHIILEANLNPNMKVATEFDSSEDSPMLAALVEAVKKGDEMVASTANNVPKGYIILMDNPKRPEGETQPSDIYDEFHPFLYKQHATKQYKEFPSFDSAVDEFFSAIEAQKIELKARQQEEAALRKLEAVRKEQTSRVENLLNQQATNTEKAQLIEYNLQMVDAAITIIRNAIASQMDWRDLEELVVEEKKRGNPIALMIDKLKLETSQITLLLSEPKDEDEDEDEEDSDEEDYEEEDDDSDDEKEEKTKNEKRKPIVHKVDVDIGSTAFANARKYYDMKRSTATKHEKTIAASVKALKSAERKIRQDLKETKITTTINKIRKPFWFEKFLWFITTEGHLVIAGRDMQQNEMIVKRYLQKEDIYVHADLHGAASVVVKNRPENAGKPIPPSSLYQAGIMSVCQSKAWDAKIVTSAYWVYPDQVSKSAPTGEYLTTGSFMIRGKKNFLPPVQLVYGFGYLFKLDESCVGNHLIQKEKLEDNEEEKGDHSTEQVVTPFEDTREGNDTEDGPQVSPEGKSPASDAVSETESISVQDEESGSSDSSDDEVFPDTQLITTSSPVQESAPAPTSSESKGWNKYALDEYGQADDSDELPEFARPQGQQQTREKKKIMSAKERRQLKKGKASDGTSTPQQSSSSQNRSENTKKNGKTEKQAPPVQVRGKKGKAKKIKEKYAEQDEEERQLRMELLGSNKGPQPKGKKAKKEAKALAEKQALAKERERKAAQEQAQAQVQVQTQETQAESNEKQGPKDNENDAEDIRQLLKEENITMLEADEMANLSVLDSLTPTPYPEDIIHFAIPVCAPYSALQKYKYKVKLTPGSLKRGKAIKQAQSVFYNLADGTAREKELIKSVPDMEAINTMMSKVKVSAPNLEASKKKKGKK